MKNGIKRSISFLLVAAMGLGLTSPVMAADGFSSANDEARNVKADEIVLESPDENDGLSMKIWLEDGTPYYTVTLNGYNLVEKSKLGMNTNDIGSFENGFSMGEVKIKDVENEPWEPVVGDYASVEDKYQEAVIPLTNENGTLTVEARIYDTGVAFRYDLPDVPDGKEDYIIGSSDEKTQFAFPEGTYAYRHIDQNQTKPSKTSVDNLGGNIYRPMTLTYENGYAMTICEANLDNYSILKLENDSSNPRTAKVKLGGDVTVRANETYLESKHCTAPAGPDVSPWRVMVIGESLTDLAGNATLSQLLNEPADENTYAFSDWVEAGSANRLMHSDKNGGDANALNNEFLEQAVDEAARRGYRYLLLDTGWQGPENDPNCDPRLDPSKLEPDKYESDKILKEQYFARPEEYENTFLKNGEGCFYTRGQGFNKYGSLGDGGNMQVDLDIPAACDYANKKGVGIILYVNGTRFFPDDMSGEGGRYRFTPDELFEYFERWGVAGVKPGFVHCDSQDDELYMQQVVEAAARHHLVLTVHDKWVPSGIERTYPNLLSAEGIYGDEEKGNVSIPEDISTIFTRTIQGPADHTFCWPGKATKGYALASPLMFRTGVNLLFWYTNTMEIPEKDKPVVDFFDNMPATWKNTLYLEGKMQEYATIARQSFADTKNDGTVIPSRWYIGSLSAVDRTLNIPLDFLDEGQYVAEIYFDGSDADPNAGFNSSSKETQTLLKEVYLVDRDTTLIYNMKEKYGYSVRLTKAEDFGDVSEIPSYDKAALQNLLRTVDALETPGYETETWRVLQKKKETAQAVMDNTAATEEEISQALAILNQAYNTYNLTVPLMDAISETNHLVPGYYTKESWAVLEKAVEKGETLLENAQPEQSEIAAATKEIQDALKNLVEDLMATKELAAYVSDLDYDSEKSWNGDTYDPSTGEGNKMDKVQKDKNRDGSDMHLIIGGKTQTYEKGMGMDAPGELYYDLTDKGYEFFEATVGVDATKQDKSNGMTFYVYGDGKLLKETVITGSKEPQKISVPIAGVKELVLATDPNGNSSHDWADWADAKFMTVKNSEGNYDYINVALNKSVEVTSIEKPENDKSYINDGNDSTRWAASSSNYPQSAVIDLGEEYNLLQFVTNFYNKNADRYYTYKIYISNDKETWQFVVDKNDNTNAGLNKDRAPENTKGRYVKLEVTGSSNTSAYASVFEFQAIAATEKPEELRLDILQYAIELAKKADTEGVIDSVKATFEQALADAENMLENVNEGVTGITQTDVDTCWQNLIKAMQYLSFKQGDKADLEKVVALAADIEGRLDSYLDDGKQVFIDALKAARETLEDGNAMQDEVNQAWRGLLEAMANLRLKPDKSALEILINEASALSEDAYEAESFGAMRTALARAQEVFADENADQKTVTAAEENLKDAVAKLVSVSEDRKTEKNDILKTAQGKQANAGQNDTSAASDHADKNASVKSAKTGDTSLAVLYVLICMGAISSAAVMGVMKRKNRK